ncbi:hypothetical protein FP507_05215 [Chlorobium phaeovibrioides]|uniref:DUF2589 domain-containing protein n=1 Tax=Chlorobium phaeovibrioides TaxID=1094 RepID=A0A5M8IBZ4_CHLPH|nr:hypothetical protein [Chlorobium phaeovibrioides]KAA6232547.1 hypothetical protein FP507_05215 [Chlorobium phaeovibrioides]
MASVGRELLDVPFPEMVTKLSLGIAEAQRALDKNSVETASLLADEEVSVVLGLTQTISDDGVKFDKQIAQVSLLQIGLMPTFYQFSEATIEVTMDIKTTTSTETNINVSAKAKVGFGCWSASVKTDVSHNRKFGKEVHGTSRLLTKMVPVPPPSRLEPVLTVIDNRTAPNTGD